MRSTAVLILSLLFVLGSLLLADAVPVAPPKEHESNDLHKRGTSYNGRATWFVPSTQGGSIGACGDFEADDAMIVAMNAKQYGNLNAKSSWCGKKLNIKSQGKSVTATVTDACPECQHGDLDLTMAVFTKLGHLDTGVLDITWEEA